MKRDKKGRKIIRGMLQTGSYGGIDNKIHLWDGKFTTGYRLVELRVVPQLPSSLFELTVKLSTEPKSSIGYVKMQDVEEIAWAGWNLPSQTTGVENFSIIAEDNMIVEDLWIQGFAGQTGEDFWFNYYLVFEKYEFTAWDGAATMVRNQSQAGSS
jgi:hypothetical protein